MTIWHCDTYPTHYSKHYDTMVLMRVVLPFFCLSSWSCSVKGGLWSWRGWPWASRSPVIISSRILVISSPPEGTLTLGQRCNNNLTYNWTFYLTLKVASKWQTFPNWAFPFSVCRHITTHHPHFLSCLLAPWGQILVGGDTFESALNLRMSLS